MKSWAANTLLLALVFCLLQISCGKKQLPSITDPKALQQDCSMLCVEFPTDKTPTNAPDFDYQHGLGIRKIPKNQWPASIAALRPYMVCSYQQGIQIWILIGCSDGGAYYVPADSTSPLPDYRAANGFIFEKTEWEGIFSVKQKF